jgi:hypothetical protein
VDISPSTLNFAITTLLKGSRLQLSNTSAGTPLRNNGAMSYFQVGDQLEQQSPGLADKVLDIPSKEEDLGAKVVAGQFFGQGGSFLVDKIRIDLNDLNVDFGSDDVTITTDTNGITATVQMTSAHPSLKCYGDAWIPVLFIPIGWQDDGCPDMELSNIVVTARFFPTVDASSHIAVTQATVTFDADIDGGTVGNGIGLFYDYRTKLKADFSAKFSEYLATDKFEAAVASALTTLVDTAVGAPGTSYASVTVDAAGLHAFPGCKAQTCASAGASCGTISDGCGGTVDCGGCPTGEACGVGAAPNQCGCGPLVCPANSCGNITDACGDSISCGGCAAGLTCQRNRCTTCQPQCGGKKCGATNGCGGTCVGSCGGKLTCQTDPDTGAHFCGAGSL